MPEIKCGLEIHGYLKIDNKRKLFCDCNLEHEASPNTNICPICTSQPGSKPMNPNEEAFRKIMMISAMLGCKINKRLLFQRKHYSWPDLPSGYQRTISGSYSVPVGVNGSFLGIGISDVHLEEDPAKYDPKSGLVDYNRSGFPLVEIVTEPDFKSSDEVKEWLRKLITTLSYIHALDKTAGIKADVNISIYPKFERVEIKNVNSFKSIVKAIEYEIHRQQDEVTKGNRIEQQTRMYDDVSETTKFMRSKETQQDYMFIPDPDLAVINVTDEDIKEISSVLPEKPAEKEKKYKKLGIQDIDAQIMSSEIILAELFEKVAKKIDPILAAKWLRRELVRVLNYNKKSLEDMQIDEIHLINLLNLVEKKKITETVAQKILEKLIIKPFDVNEYVKKENLIAVSDTNVLERYCKEAIAENKKAVDDYISGKEEALHFLMGQVMRKTRGAATPKEVQNLLKKFL